MKMPEKLDRCKLPECTSENVWQDEDGNLLRLTGSGNFQPHKCTTKSDKPPKIAYLAEWYNTRTGFTRQIGPDRMRKTVEIPPPSSGHSRKWPIKADQTEWVLKGVSVSPLNWKPVKD